MSLLDEGEFYSLETTCLSLKLVVLFFLGYRETFFLLVCFSLQLSVWIMVDLTRIWGNLNLSEMEDTGFVLQSDQRSREIKLAATFLSSRFLSMEVMARTFKQIRRPTNGF